MSGTALIGSTGFVGTTLRRQMEFDACFHRADADAMRGRSFDLVVCCGAPAAKWQANREPAADWANLAALMENLRLVNADRFVLISTVDVYPSPVGVDEDTPIELDDGHPYGAHRYRLERFVVDYFSGASVIRLPALFGAGLKKNLVFDLLNGRGGRFTHPDSVFQFYDMELLWPDVVRIATAGLSCVNMVSEPVRADDLANSIFAVDMGSATAGTNPVAYDVRSRHCGHWQRSDGYLYGWSEIADRLRRFVARERAE